MTKKKSKSKRNSKARTVGDVRRLVRQIREISYDEEAAHALEDELYARVLEVISEGTPDASALAKAALRSQKIPLARWCA